jgi:aspartate aminotransferase-like enzyme
MGSNPESIPVNLVYAYHAGLTAIVKGGKPAIEKRLELHRQASSRVKKMAADLGLKLVATSPSHAANGMTAVSYNTISGTIRC